MKLSRDTYIRRSLGKLTHKSWEHYVINRLVHRLDDPEIEFICQQHVKADGARYLTDVYFPQFDLHLEVDEPGHEGNEEKDSARSTSIIGLTSHSITRIRVHEAGRELPLATVNAEIEILIGALRRLKSEKIEKGLFAAWSADNEDRPEDFYKKGFISSEENAFFRTKTAALSCFGFGKKSLQQGSWRESERPGYCVWLPQFVKQGAWKNTLSADTKIITEECTIGSFRRGISEEAAFRYVFGKMDDIFGKTFFKFLGEYHLNFSTSTEEHRVYNLMATRVATISPPGKYDPHKKFGGPVNAAFSSGISELIKNGELKPKL